MKLGIYIGSFNPPHKGHIHVVNYLIEKKIIDKILIVPTGNYWNKQNLASLNHRINMLKLYENDNIIIDVVNNNYQYTYQLMRKLKEIYRDMELYLIIGADNIISFNKWKNYEELLNYNIIIMNRSGIDIDKYLENYPQGKFTIAKDFIPIEISSTDIRNDIDNENIDEEIKKYIKKNQLYR